MAATVARAEPGDAGAIGRLAALADSPFDVEQEFERKHARIWVARGADEPEIAGFLLSWEVADEVHVIDLVVAEEQRRKGFGRALLEAVLSRARETGARLVLLEVRRSNAGAIRLYASVGFAHAGERLAYYTDGEDACLMQMELRAPA